MATANEIKFRRDTSFRKAVFSPGSFAHPAKMDAQLLLWIVDRYTKPGDTILDPMAGSGTATLGCAIGRNVVQVELEKKFVDMQEANWERVRMLPQLGHEMGDCRIIQGDARQLEGILADSIITSPPYAEAQEGAGIARRGYQGPKHGPTDLIGKRSYMPNVHGESDGQIGNLPYGSIDSVITSPPYEGSIQGTPGIDWTKMAGGSRDMSKEAANSTRIASLSGYSADADNIGNLRGETYLSAMLRVYRQCHKVLKPDGLMILVTKNFIRDRKEVKLDEDTIKLCEQAGFKLVARHCRKLPGQSFWRTIYQQKYPEAPVLDKEDILVFQKVGDLAAKL